jgi:hypothetical protein
VANNRRCFSNQICRGHNCLCGVCCTTEVVVEQDDSTGMERRAKDMEVSLRSVDGGWRSG